VLSIGIGLAGFSGSASAKTVHAAGSISCSFGTTMTFSPPLTPGPGTVVAKGVNELITVAPATIGGCSGTVTTGSVPVSGVTTKAVVVKLKPLKVGKVDYAGGCFSFAPFQLALKHVIVAWTPISGTMAPTSAKLSAGALGADGAGNLGYSMIGTARSSFVGPVTLGAFFDAASTLAIQNCIAGTGSVTSVTVDPTQSTLTLG
jgi:hypothetical protein